MIINIRGTHGSGKSTVVRNVMSTFPNRVEIRTHIRRRPWGYICSGDDKAELFIPGHYETPCGGCDTLPVVEDFFNMIREHAEKRHVLFEGILAQHYAMRKFVALKQKFPLMVLILDTPLRQCIADTEHRRSERGQPMKDKIIDTITGEYNGVMNKVPKLRAQGVEVKLVSREDALGICLEYLK